VLVARAVLWRDQRLEFAAFSVKSMRHDIWR
jgi:hypothetical protein